MAKIEIIGGNWDYFIYIDYQNEIGIMLIIEMAKIELTGGHIENYACYRDYQDKINRRPY